VFKSEKFTRFEDSKGIDWWLYAKRIYLDLLYPYYEAVQRANPDKEVYLVEDNAPSHQKASRFLEEVRKERGIRKVPHPPNSPNLN